MVMFFDPLSVRISFKKDGYDETIRLYSVETRKGSSGLDDYFVMFFTLIKSDDSIESTISLKGISKARIPFLLDIASRVLKESHGNSTAIKRAFDYAILELCGEVSGPLGDYSSAKDDDILVFSGDDARQAMGEFIGMFPTMKRHGSGRQRSFTHDGVTVARWNEGGIGPMGYSMPPTFEVVLVDVVRNWFKYTGSSSNAST